MILAGDFKGFSSVQFLTLCFWVHCEAEHHVGRGCGGQVTSWQRKECG